MHVRVWIQGQVVWFWFGHFRVWQLFVNHFQKIFVTTLRIIYKEGIRINIINVANITLNPEADRYVDEKSCPEPSFEIIGLRQKK